MKIKKEYISGLIGGLIGGALATIGLSMLFKKLDKEKKSGVILGDDLMPQGGLQDAIIFTMKNTSASAQKITIFDGYSLTSVQNQNPNISISSTPDLQTFTMMLSKQPLQLRKVRVKCGKSSFSGAFSSFAPSPPPVAPPVPPPAPPVAPLAPPVPPPAPPVVPPVAPPVPPPAPPVAPPVAPPSPTANCEQQIEQPFMVKYTDANGQSQTAPVFPMVSAWQSRGNMAEANMKNIILDAQTVISEYTILPNTSVTMTFWWKDPKKNKKK